MNKQGKWMLLSIRQKVESIQTDIQVMNNAVLNKEDKEARDKLIWAQAKLNDLQRLLYSIKK